MEVYNVYLMVELPCWLAVLLKAHKSRCAQSFFGAVAALYVVVYTFCLARFGFAEIFDALVVFKGIVLTAAACFVLLEMSAVVEPPMWQRPMFWIASGGLVYFSITAVFFSLLSTVLLSQDPIVSDSWNFHSVVNMFANVLYTVGLSCSFLKVNSFSPSPR